MVDDLQYSSGAFCVSLMLPHQTTENLIKTGVFGISIPGTDLQKALLASGCCSGRVVGDKFEHLKLGKVAGLTLPVSFVEGALAHIECRVVDPNLLKRTGLAIGEAVAARVNDQYWARIKREFISQPRQNPQAPQRSPRSRG